MKKAEDFGYMQVHKIFSDLTIKSEEMHVNCHLKIIVERKALTSDAKPRFKSAWRKPNYEPINAGIFRSDNKPSVQLQVIRITEIENLNPMNDAVCEPEASPKMNQTEPQHEVFPAARSGKCSAIKRDSKVLNIPTMINCQNCEMHFPTKYQFQRHQCVFNAEKIVLKPNVDASEVEKGVRIKFECDLCDKKFVSKNNLDRHRTCHDKNNLNICEYCKKQFVSDNRLRIHKENHCKKAGDISKFYRSDIVVWRCLKCFQVFASAPCSVLHSNTCRGGCSNAQDENAADEKALSLEEANENLSDVCDLANALIEHARKKDAEPLILDISNETKVDRVKTELVLQCEFCNSCYANKKSLLWHQKTHNTNKNYSCVVCAQTFISYTIAAKHWLTSCNRKASLFFLPKMSYCHICDRTFKSHDILYTHRIKKKHYWQKKYVARNESIVDVIQEALDSIDEKENLMEVSTDVQEQESSCSKDEDDEKSAEKKKKRGRKRKLFSDVMGAFRNSTVSEGFRYQCERCGDVADSVAKLEEHRNEAHPENFQCDQCDQVVQSAKALLIHSRAHKSLKPYMCDICKRSYSQTSHLWQHMRFHQGIKPFACPHEGCDARYTIRPDLKDHIRKVHTRERPFCCKVCNKCFLTGSVYYQHRLIHTNDRRYQCELCDKRFFRADALNNHRRIHTDEKPYPCEVCNRHFRQKGDRNKHMRTQHPAIDIVAASITSHQSQVPQI